MFIIQTGTLEGGYSIHEVSDNDPRYTYGFATLHEAQQAVLRITTEINYDDADTCSTNLQSSWAKAANEKLLKERERSNKSVTRTYGLKKKR
jgi:hypothetical protein